MRCSARQARLLAAAMLVCAIPSGLGCASAPGTKGAIFDEGAGAPAPGVSSEAKRGGTIVIGLTESIDPVHAPVPTNDAERTLFRNLYEPLVEASGSGRGATGIVAARAISKDGTTTTFDLEEGARFWDGSPLDATDVRLSWIVAERQSRASGREEPWVWLEGGGETETVAGSEQVYLAQAAVSVLAERRLSARLAMPLDGSGRFFSQAAFAIADRRPGDVWPVGTGAFRALPLSTRDERHIVCLPNEQRPRAAAAPWVRLIFRIRPGRDERDLHEEGVDVLLVRDRATLNYFATLPEYKILPGPCDRLYVLLVPPATADAAAADRVPWETLITTDVQSSLARNVTVSDAEGCVPLLAASGSTDECRGLVAGSSKAGERAPREAAAGGAPTRAGAARILYRNGDEDSKRLAERLGAIAEMAAPRAARFRLVGLAPADFDRALAAGDGEAFVARLDYWAPSACVQLASLLDAAPWLVPSIAGPDSAATNPGEPGGDGVLPLQLRLRDQGLVLPLVATRMNVVARRGLVGLRFDDDGALCFDKAGWAPEAREP